MPSDKRQRQRENSRARQEAAIAAAAKAKRRTRVLLIGLAVVVFGGAIAFAMAGGDDDSNTETASRPGTTAKSDATETTKCPPADASGERVTSFSAPFEMCIDTDKKYTALIKTDVGDVTVELDAKAAPNTVNNFVSLARNHYYDGIVFHRVIKNFMVQGGDPEGTGSGGPGYSIPDEFSKDHEFKVGDIAMAKTVQPDSGGSQFFIVTGPQGEALPPEYAYFGKVTAGLETVRKIEADGADQDPTPPAVVHKIVSVTITEE